MEKYFRIAYQPTKAFGINLPMQLALVILIDTQFKEEDFKQAAKTRIKNEDYEPVIFAISEVSKKNLESALKDVMSAQYGFTITFEKGRIITSDIAE